MILERLYCMIILQRLQGVFGCISLKFGYIMNEVFNLTKEITEHVDFLRETGLSITFSAISPVFAPVMTTLLKYEAHLPPVCSYLKAHKSIPGKCISNKARLCAKHVTAPYYSCCWAGVEEFVFPISVDGARIMLINVSGYRSTMRKSAIMKNSLSAKLSDTTFDELYEALSPSPPTVEYVRAAITPLMHLITELHQSCLSRGIGVDDALYVKILDCVHQSFDTDCTCTSIACALSYSESYVRHLFRQKSGTSLGQYIIDVRLSHARDLINSTELSVADVASATGFFDPNYFSSAFKKKFGISPLKMRNLAKRQ